jgi:hypothetical protein
VSLQELDTHWSLEDALDAHTVLDAFDVAEAKVADQQERERDRRRYGTP